MDHKIGHLSSDKMIERFKLDLESLDKGVPSTQLKTSLGKFVDYIRAGGIDPDIYQRFSDEISKSIPDETELLKSGRLLLSSLGSQIEQL